MAAELPVPFEAFWGATLSQLPAADLAAASVASRAMSACVGAAAERALEQFFAPGRVRQPFGLSWPETLHRACDLSWVLVLGGEDAADMPQLHLSMVALSRTGARHTPLPPSGRPQGCSLPTGRYRLAAARVGPMIYVTGGTGPEGDPCLEVLRFDTLSHLWDDRGAAAGEQPLRPAMGAMPIPRFGHEAVCVLGRYLLCIGGKAAGFRESPEGSDDVVGGSSDVLDTATGRWLPLPCRLENPRVYFGAAVVGSFVVVCGGMAPGGARQAQPGASEGRLSSTEILDAADLPLLFSEAGDNPRLQSLSWRPGPHLQFARYDFSLAGPIDRRLFAVGGSGARRLVEELNVSELSSASDQRPARSSEVQNSLLSEGWADVHGRAGYASGGSSPSATQATSRNGWLLHPVELPASRSCGNVVAVGNRLVLAGGSERAVFSYEPDAASWVDVGAELDTMRLGAKAVAFSGLHASWI